jgi:WD40 repeat protein
VADNSGEGAAFVAGGAATGAWVSTTVGGMGLAGGFGAVGIGMAPVAATGAVAGAAAYGAFRAIGENDAFAFGAIGIGAVGGIGISTTFGGMGLAAGGTAVGIGIGTMAAAGGVFGLGVYGLAKMLQETGTKEPPAQAFARMEEKILFQEAYIQALMELDPKLAEEAWKQKFAVLEIDEELKALKAQIPTKNSSYFNFAAPKFYKPTFTPFIKSRNSATKSTASEYQSVTVDIEPEQLSLKAEMSQTWRCIHTLKWHTASVNSVAISPDGQTLATASDDTTVNLWNLKTGKLIFTFFGLLKAVFSVTFSPDGQMIASGDLDKTITTWKVDTKAMRSLYSHAGSRYSHAGYVYSIAYRPDGEILASGSADKTIKIWNLRRWVSTRTLTGHSDTVWSVAISPDGQTLASGSADKTIRLWPLNSWEQPCILMGHSGWVNSVAITPNGQTLASGSTDSTIKLWNLQTGELLCTLTGHSSAVFSVAISPDGNTLASASRNSVKLWNLHTGELLNTLAGSNPVVFSPDGQILVTGGEDSTIKIWNKCFGVNESTVDFVPSGEWWEVLGVNKNADLDEVKQAYRRLGRQYHPDVNDSVNAKATMQAINKAYKEFQQLEA